MHFNKKIVAIVAACIAVPIVAAGAAATTSGSEFEVRPAVSNGSNNFYTEAQIADAWSAVTANFPEALPAGIEFPTETPEIFEPRDGYQHQWEAGMVYTVAARYWRCSWLGAELDAQASGDVAAASEAAAIASGYAELAYVDEAYVDGGVDTYLSDIAAAADDAGIAAAKYEYDLECKPLDNTVLEVGN